MRIILLLLVTTFTFPTSSWSQINWSIGKIENINPTAIALKGSVTLRKDNQLSITIDGNITLQTGDTKILVTTNTGTYYIKRENVVGIKPDNYKYLSGNLIGTKELSDSLMLIYRRSIYSKLDLNEVEIIQGRKPEYSLSDKGLIVTNQKLTKSKVCKIDVHSITVLDSSGEVSILSEGDFNCVVLNGENFFSCYALYNRFYSEYQEKRSLYSKAWKNAIKEMPLDSFLLMFGPFNRTEMIDIDKKIFVWDKKIVSYDVNLSNSYRSLSFLNKNLSLSLNTQVAAISPVFLFYNEYSNLSGNLSNTANTNSQSNYTGGIISNEFHETVMLIRQGNATIDVYEENIFSKKAFGSQFNFIGQ
jgi:hypothetical protein